MRKQEDGNNSELIHDNNEFVPLALSIRQFWGKNQMNVLSQPPYFPDLSACDFFLLLNLKLAVRWRRFWHY